MQIRLNGNPIEIEDGATVADLVAARGLAAEQVAVEVNERLVARDRRAQHALAPLDRVELVTLVGGG
ncbi:MAG: sulfur carrier protein ThiS [Planctomycetes bacterium]|nr:sulfur carrier protein ThiS [Planctomycetota bacterium]MCB9905853.1 sulfur carrier protein ThiS [Planctomycetota bacterium]